MKLTLENVNFINQYAEVFVKLTIDRNQFCNLILRKLLVKLTSFRVNLLQLKLEQQMLSLNAEKMVIGTQL